MRQRRDGARFRLRCACGSSLHRPLNGTEDSMNKVFAAAAGIAALTLPYGLQAQTPCRGTALAGTVKDSTDAVIASAEILVDGAMRQASGADGRYRFPCVSDGPHQVVVSADGF